MIVVDRYGDGGEDVRTRINLILMIAMIPSSSNHYPYNSKSCIVIQ
jgi:hypothetical protein